MPKKSKIKTIHIISGLGQGGAEKALFELVTRLSPNISVVIVSLSSRGFYGEQLSKLGITVEALEMPQGRITLYGLIKLWKILRKEKPLVVQTWMYHADLIGGLMARLACIRKVFWGVHHFNLSPSANSLQTRIVARLCAALSYFIPTKIICVARSAVKVHIRFGYCSKKFIVIPLGFDLEKFRAPEFAQKKLRTELHIPNEKRIIACVARWHAQKDHRNLFNALAQLSYSRTDWICILVGAGMDSHNQKLNRLVIETQLDERLIIKHGSVDDPLPIFQEIDFLVLSSCGETFPTVVGEAMACEKPCVVTDVGDTSAIVGTSGWVVPVADFLSLSSALSSALDEIANSKKWNCRKASCRNEIQTRFPIASMTWQYEHAWFTDD